MVIAEIKCFHFHCVDCFCGVCDVADLFNVAQGCYCSDNCGVGVLLEDVDEGAGVVGLGVVEDDVVDGGIADDIVDAGETLVGKVLFDGLEKNVAFGGLEKEGVVGGAEGCGHDNVKDSEIFVEGSNPV